ncbi:uncharacterized protein KRP23_2993 [Phytophthora ramorum]|uniref:Apple domain-containing protein n=1 Tax=Phytophthora ramorum TaxID=164328 RepID=H3GZD9_PHYRM|nr:hypothetical protein KRP23_2993 [Phytophthora ramorum]
MLRWVSRAIASLLVFSDVAFARDESRTLFLSTYSEDLACSDIVYARIDNVRCTDTSVCTIHNESDGSFHDTEMTACILDREEFLSSAFNGAAYLTVELYPADCLGKSYNTRSFLADGKCHPYALNSHFKVVQDKDGTTSVFSADSGCESNNWYEEWSADSDTEVNTEACLSDGSRTWKSFFVAGAAAADKSAGTTDSTSNASATAAPVTTAPPVSTTATPITNSTTLASSSRQSSHSFAVSAAALFVSMILLGTMVP